MGCETIRKRLIREAIEPGGDAALAAHLRHCAACRSELERQRALAQAIESELAASVAGEPGADFAARICRRLAEEAPPRRVWLPGWIPAAAGAVAVIAIFSLWLGRRAPVQQEMVSGGNAPTVHRPQPALVKPETISTAKRPAETAGERGLGRRRARPARHALSRAPHFEVLVEPGQREAILLLYRAAQSPRVDASVLVAKPQPIEPKELKIAPLEIAALDADARPARQDSH